MNHLFFYSSWQQRQTNSNCFISFQCVSYRSISHCRVTGVHLFRLLHTRDTHWMLTQSVYANVRVCVRLHACVTKVKGTKRQDTECPKQDGRAMFGLPHTPFLCTHSSCFFGWDQNWAPDSHQGPMAACKLTLWAWWPLNYAAMSPCCVAKKEIQPDSKRHGTDCAHTQTRRRTHRQGSHTLKYFASVRPHLLALAVFAPVTRWSCDAAATKGHQSLRPNNGTSVLAGVSLILVCTHMCFV